MLGQTSPLPPTDEGWFLEIALDVEWAHAMAPAANIELVYASESNLNDLSHASYTAATMLGASVVSQSWGLLEIELGSSYEQFLENDVLRPSRRERIRMSRSWRPRATAARQWSDLPLESHR